ncbi:tumor suppressor candidate 2-like [Ylistrum balloti]|uniref:tumor suppressor candidate 2-like n=1 Tax=Ylistrum balloti TaxID=509963 RepID=UPI002905F08B|nr:tumor suppressor candidate 2-like [Ylistrum balloti]
MGQKTSSLASKVSKSVSSLFTGAVDDSQSCQNRSAVTPFVFKRSGSMYFDEDGDLAHEFYVEIIEGRHHYMKKQYRNLRPQGEVDLPHPRLNVDFPIVICEAPR